MGAFIKSYGQPFADKKLGRLAFPNYIDEIFYEFHSGTLVKLQIKRHEVKLRGHSFAFIEEDSEAVEFISVVESEILEFEVRG